MATRSDVCDPCIKLGTLAGTEVEKKTNSLGWGLVVATGVTALCVVGLAYLNAWVRSEETEPQTFRFCSCR